MGQKVNPIGLRLGINKDWQSNWYADSKDVPRLLNADLKLRKFLKTRLKDLEEALEILSAQLSPVLEKPEFDLSTLLGTPAGDGNSFGPKQEAKAAAKEGRVLPNTGMNSSSTAALGLSLIALVGIAVRRKLSK